LNVNKIILPIVILTDSWHQNIAFWLIQIEFILPHCIFCSRWEWVVYTLGRCWAAFGYDFVFSACTYTTTPLCEDGLLLFIKCWKVFFL